jgi:hypothetical protein
VNLAKWTAVTAFFALVLMSVGCSSSPPPNTPMFNKPASPDVIQKLITPEAVAAREDGIAAAILLDTSGSMQDPVQSSDRKPKAKIQVAQDALFNVLQQFTNFAKRHPDKKILVGIYDFSGRKGQPSCRQVVKLGPPDPAAAQDFIRSMMPSGNTPIGDALIAAKRDLQATGFLHQHIMVITDGENNLGYLPEDVTRIIGEEKKPEDRAGVYFVAFDIGAEIFNPVRDAGAMVMSATSEQQLTDTLDYILTGKILVEQPPPPPSHPVPLIKK